MLAAVRGIIRDNAIIVENEDLRPYDGTEVVVTLLDNPVQTKQKKAVDWDSFVIPSERGKNVDGYMREMRDNDRLKREFAGWERWQILWLFSANGIILGVSIYLGDTVLGILASLTGVTCTILCGMGRVSNYFFGAINIVLYAIVAWKAKYYGEVMLNLLYYFPTNIIGWVVWSRHLDQGKNEVDKNRMTRRQDFLLAVISVAGVLGYSWLLKVLGGNLPLVDSISTVLSVIAQILLIKRYMEQWVIWIIVDTVSVVMWIAAFFTGGESVAVLMMWSVYLANGVIMFVKWLKESKQETSHV